ncbi:MAG: serine/threonine protein kinase [Dehalococcoidia bacterium]|nr:serine/threonine protein kinase [Dehalococcoidia bacterium]
MKAPIKLSVENLAQMPYSLVLCYPYTNSLEIMNRISELKELGVESVELTGNAFVSTVPEPSIPVTGKGHMGIVVVAHVGAKQLALKIRRIDSVRKNCFHEAEMLQKANKIGIGPKFVAATKNYLLSQYIDGDLLTDWLVNHQDKASFRMAINDVFEQCWRLDRAGLDHGELSKPAKHLIVDKQGKPFIVDFETASTTRKVANVTAVCQYLFIKNNAASRLVSEVLGEKDRPHIVEMLRHYKNDRIRQCFEELV